MKVKSALRKGLLMSLTAMMVVGLAGCGGKKAATTGVKLCGFTAALLPFCIGLFLFMRGSETFLVFGHSLQEFLFSGQWAPSDTASGGGQVGAAMFISGSLVI